MTVDLESAPGVAPELGTEGAFLRVGVVLDGLRPAAWVGRAVREIHRSRFARIVVVIGQDQAAAKTGAQEEEPIARRLLHHVYARVDARLSPIVYDPFAPCDLTADLRDVPRVDLDGASDTAIAALGALDLDVVLELSSRPLPDRALGIARAGVWFYGFGEGFREVMTQVPIVSELRVRHRDCGSHVLYRSSGATDPLSVRRTVKSCYWKSSTFALRALRDLHPADSSVMRHDVETPRPDPPAPSGRVVTAAIARLVRAAALDGVRGMTTRHQWILAHRFDSTCVGPVPTRAIDSFDRIVPPSDRFWADPFVAKHGNGWVVLFEERLYRSRIGHIAGFEIDRHRRRGEVFRALACNYHLSYPFIFQWDGTWWMVPESERNRTVDLWRAVDFPHRWTLERTLLANVRAVDASLFEYAGAWWMFCSIGERGASTDDELHLFRAASPVGPWIPHPRNPVRSDIRGARPAGRPFVSNGVLLRPGQDCSTGYGSGIVLYRVDRIDTRGYAEAEVARLSAGSDAACSGTHTINAADGLTVIDLRLPRPRSWLTERIAPRRQPATSDR